MLRVIVICRILRLSEVGDPYRKADVCYRELVKQLKK